MNGNEEKALITELGERDFRSEVLRSKLPVLVEFWAPWSRPCQILSSALDEAASTCRGSVKVVTVNADDNPTLSLWYEIRSIPTLLFFLDGNLRGRIVGTASKEAILAQLRAVLGGQSTESPVLPPSPQ